VSDSAKLRKVKGKKRRGRPRGPTRMPTETRALEALATIRARDLSIQGAAAIIGVSAGTLSAWLSDGVRTLYAEERLRAAGFIA
jgi:hypothetical protein